MKRPPRPDDDGSYVDMDAFAESDVAGESPSPEAAPAPEPERADAEPAEPAASTAPAADSPAQADATTDVVTPDEASPADASTDASTDASADASVEADPAPVYGDPEDGSAPAKPKARKPAKAGAKRRAPQLLFLAIGVAIGLGVAWSVNGMGGPSAAAGMPSNHPDISGATAAPSSAAPLDEAKVAQWKAQAEAEPANVEPLRSLTTEYGRVKQYGEAAVWQRKIVDLDPANTDERLVLGVALYNDNQLAPAEAEWLTVAEQAPTSADPWYNLGFLYLSQDPPNSDKAEAAWRKVLELAPNTELAAAVTNHLDSLDTVVPVDVTPTPAPTPSK